jgi:hypothetical protein
MQHKIAASSAHSLPHLEDGKESQWFRLASSWRILKGLVVSHCLTYIELLSNNLQPAFDIFIFHNTSAKQRINDERGQILTGEPVIANA